MPNSEMMWVFFTWKTNDINKLAITKKKRIITSEEITRSANSNNWELLKENEFERIYETIVDDKILEIRVEKI